MTLAIAFASFKTDALRIESLPAYKIPEEAEALLSFLKGEKPDLSFLSEWHKYLDDVVRSGRTSRRIRLLSDPLSDYEKLEIKWGYPANAKHGEQVRCADRQILNNPIDVWLFDNEIGFKMIYDEDGSFLESKPLGSAEAQKLVDWARGVWPKLADFTSFDEETSSSARS